jgi:hypothetical protein
VAKNRLDHFLSFAAVSYQFLALDPDVADDMNATEYFGTATTESSRSDLEYDFMVVVDLLDIIDSNYSLYLASEVSLLMGYKGKLVIDDSESLFGIHQ